LGQKHVTIFAALAKPMATDSEIETVIVLRGVSCVTFHAKFSFKPALSESGLANFYFLSMILSLGLSLAGDFMVGSARTAYGRPAIKRMSSSAFMSWMIRRAPNLLPRLSATVAFP
jgi:hypothetical protein